MTTAYDRGWGDPSTRTYRSKHIVTIDVGGVRLHVRREAAALFAAFIHRIASRGYNLSARKDDWGYIFRPVRGYEAAWAATHDFKYLSNHSWGLAVDLNAQTNPMTSDGRVHTDMPSWVIDEAHEVGLSWGGDYTGLRKDPMHFEVLRTPSDVARLVRGLEDDMYTDADRARDDKMARQVQEIHDAIYKGYPTYAQPGIEGMIAEIRKKVLG